MLNRITPAAPHQAFQTFRVSAPLATHHRRATCAEVDCEKLERGFRIISDPTTDKGRRQRHLIMNVYRRPCTAVRRPDGLVEYVFAPGTSCFDNHYRPLFREPIALLRLGDWRTPRSMRRTRAMPVPEWLDRFGTHQQRLAERANRG